METNLKHGGSARTNAGARWLLVPGIVLIPAMVLLVVLVVSLLADAAQQPGRNDATVSMNASSPGGRDVVSYDPPTTDPSLPAAANVLTSGRATDGTPVSTF